MNEKNIPFLDHEEIVNSILWGKAERLENMVTDSIQPGDRFDSFSLVVFDMIFSES